MLHFHSWTRISHLDNLLSDCIRIFVFPLTALISREVSRVINKVTRDHIATVLLKNTKWNYMH